jgi:phage portal protein BeeE
MGRWREWWTRTDWEPVVRAELPPPTPLQAALARKQAERAWSVSTREEAMRNSVVNRARDLTCGVLSSLPFERLRNGQPIDPGWLTRPDPDHTRGWFVSEVTDDLFFRGEAWVRITARDASGYPIAVQAMPWVQVTPWWSGFELERVDWTPTRPAMTLTVPGPDVIHFESPVTGVLENGNAVLSIASRLDRSADRFAGAEVPAGWLKATGGEDLTPAEQLEQITVWQQSRELNSTAFLNQLVDYHESSMDPSRLQLVEGRSYQDAATARIANVPNFLVGVAVPGDSFTYRTALTARLDYLDFSVGAYLDCWGQTLSSDQVCPHGQSVQFDPTNFLRSAQLTGNPDQTVVTTTPGG